MNILDIFKNWSDEDGLTVKGKAGISTLGNIANVGIQALGKGNTTTLGNIANTVGGLIPGPWGVAVQTAGNLVNAAFGSNINDNIVDSYMSDISSLANQQYNASDYKSLLAQQRNNNITIDKNSLGTQGWLSDKLDTTFNDLNAKLRDAEEQNRMAFNNQAAEINKSIFNTSLTNMRKRGGKLYIQPKRVFNNGGLMHQHGGIFSNGITFIDNGGTHEQNPFEGVQMGVDNQGIPNMVEEGEVVWQDYVFSNRLKPTKEFKDKYKLKGETFADIAKEIQKESEERPNDPISRSGLEDSMTKLMIEQEGIRQKNNKQSSNKFADGSWLRYAPVVGSALGVFSDLVGTTNKPDYSNISLIQDATDRITPVGYTPIGTYLSYNPFDKNYYSNKLSEQAGATRRAITNQAINPGAAMAGLLAADYNAQTQLGGLFRQAEEYNQAQREKVAGFNRQTDAMNSEMAMKAAIANQSADELRLKSAITQAQMREQADATASAAKSANLSGLFTNLGNVGIDIMNRADRDMLIKSGVFGTLSQKPTDWSDDKWELYQEALNMRACGGKINRKKVKRGLTY